MREKDMTDIEVIEKKCGCKNPGIAQVLIALNKKFYGLKHDRINQPITGVSIQSSGCFMWYGESEDGESIDWNEIVGGYRQSWDFKNDTLYAQNSNTVKFLGSLLRD